MLNEQQVKRTAIFRALQLGDLLCSIPAVRAFKQAFPSSEITLVGLPWAESFVSRFSHYFSGFIPFPGYPGLPEQEFHAAAFEKFSKTVKDLEFDLILQMQGNGTIVNSMIKTLNAKLVAGFTPYGDSITPETRWMRYPDGGHEIDRHLALMSFLGAISTDTRLEFPVFQKDRQDLAAIGLPLKKGQYVCIHPGSRGTWRQWPPPYFAAVGNYIHAIGLEVVLTGTESEMSLIRHVASLFEKSPFIAAGETTLGSLAALIEQSAAIICNCTGVSHIASALNKPAVVISMDGDPWRWAPKNSELQRCIDWTRNPDYMLVLKEVAALFFRL